MPSWESAKLGDVCGLQNGFAFKSKLFKPNGIPVLRISSIQDEQVCDNRPVFAEPEDYKEDLSKYKVQDGELLIAMSGATTGKVGFNRTGKTFLLNQRVGKFEPSPSLNIYYLFYFLSTQVEENLAISSGSAQPNLSTKQIKDFAIPLPPITEQKCIVAIVDEAFAGIDAAVANTENNLANARELFESTLNGVFTQKGDGWVEKTVGELAIHCLGKMLDKKKNKGTLKPYLRNLNVRWFDFDLTDLLEMRFEESETERYSAQKGDVLICEGGYPGRAAIWPHDETIFFQKALHRVCFKEPIHNRWFMYYLYLSDSTGSLRQYFTGAGIQHFTGQALKRFRLPIVATSEIRQHVERFDSLHIETKKLEAIYQQKLKALAELKQSILQKAFAGELTTLPEKIVEEANA